MTRNSRNSNAGTAPGGLDRSRVVVPDNLFLFIEYTEAIHTTYVCVGEIHLLKLQLLIKEQEIVYMYKFASNILIVNHY